MDLHCFRKFHLEKDDYRNCKIEKEEKSLKNAHRMIEETLIVWSSQSWEDLVEEY